MWRCILQELPPFCLEMNPPLFSVPDGFGEAGGNQIVERSADRHRRVMQAVSQEEWRCHAPVEVQDVMEKDGLGGGGQAVRLSFARCTEMLAQIDRQIRYIELVAGNDKRNTLTNEARPVVRTDVHGSKRHRRMGGIADYVDMLGDVGWSACAVELGNDDALASKNAGLVERVDASDKCRQAARGFEWTDINAFMKKLSQVAF